MTYLLLQTFLLLLSAYFAGALCGCLAKRALMTRSPDMAAVAARTSPANYIEPPDENIPLIRPREIDPVQPRIEVFPRPVRKEFAVSDKLDISRFERALIGPDPNEGMPRKMIVQIRPAVLKPVTGPAQPFKKPEPKVEAPKAGEPSKPVTAKTDAPKIEPAKLDATKTEPAKPVSATPAPPAKSEPVKPEPSKADAAAAQAAANIAAGQKSVPTPATPAAEKPKAEPSKDAGVPSQGASPMMAGIAGASAAAAAAVAAAKAAAAAVVPRAAPSSAQQQKPVADLKPAEPAKPAVSTSATVLPPGPATPGATPSATQATTPGTPAPVASPAAKPQPVSAPAAVAKPDVTPDVTETLAKAVAPQPSTKEPVTARAPAGQDVGHAHAATPGDDLQRIRAIDAETMRRLADISINSFEQIAHWTPADVNRVNQALGLAGRVDREQWIEQAQILAKGGETYYSRNRAAATKSPASPASSATPAQPAVTPAPAAPSQAQPVQPKPVQTAPIQPAATQPAASATQTSVPTVAKPKDVAPAAAVPAAAAPALAPAAPTPAPQASSAQTPPAPQVEAAKPAAAAPPVATSAAAPQQAPAPTTAGSALQGKSVAEMAAAAAAAIAAASASVTRGIRPIEPISPLTRANPNIVMPAKLSDALKDNESKAPTQPSTSHPPAATHAKPGTKPDDLKRIRGIGVLIEKRLNALGITTYAEIANWNSADIDRISQTLEFKGRIERESWVEHARILASGGQTEFSRRVDRGDVESSRDDS